MYDKDYWEDADDAYDLGIPEGLLKELDKFDKCSILYIHGVNLDINP